MKKQDLKQLIKEEILKLTEINNQTNLFPRNVRDILKGTKVKDKHGYEYIFKGILPSDGKVGYERIILTKGDRNYYFPNSFDRSGNTTIDDFFSYLTLDSDIDY